MVKYRSYTVYEYMLDHLSTYETPRAHMPVQESVKGPWHGIKGQWAGPALGRTRNKRPPPNRSAFVANLFLFMKIKQSLLGRVRCGWMRYCLAPQVVRIVLQT